MAQLVKNLPAMSETWVQSLGWEDPLERLPTPVFWPREFHGLYSPWGHKELDTTEPLSLTQKAASIIFKTNKISSKQIGQITQGSSVRFRKRLIFQMI